MVMDLQRCWCRYFDADMHLPCVVTAPIHSVSVNSATTRVADFSPAKGSSFSLERSVVLGMIGLHLVLFHTSLMIHANSVVQTCCFPGLTTSRWQTLSVNKLPGHIYVSSIYHIEFLECNMIYNIGTVIGFSSTTYTGTETSAIVSVCVEVFNPSSGGATEKFDVTLLSAEGWVFYQHFSV